MDDENVLRGKTASVPTKVGVLAVFLFGEMKLAKRYYVIF